jgi:hypothetical protein
MCLILSAPLFSQQTCIDYVTDEWNDSRYNVQLIGQDRVVTDLKTNLMWKQCSEGLSAADCSVGSIVSLNWQEALNVPVTVNNTTGYAGFNDWRLPNVKELSSLVARNCSFPSINENVFPNNPTTWIWSASPFLDDDANTSWFVDFFSGPAGIDFRIFSNFIRLVRSNK